MKKNFYSFSADVIRVVAIIGVVVIHITGAVYTRPDFFGGITWWITIILDSLSRISIPLFIMLSGYLLLRKNESLEKSIKRIFSRLAIPFIFWLLFYLWYGNGIPNFIRVNGSIFQKIFQGNVYHLYFLVILFGLYFFAPLFASYIRAASSASQHFLMKFLLVLGVAYIALQFIFRSCSSDTLFTMWIPYAGLFVAGYVLGEKSAKFHKNKLMLGYIAAFIATLSLNYLTYYLLMNHNHLLASPRCLSNYTDHYVSINVVFMSLCAFLLLLHFQYERLKKYPLAVKIVQSIAKASFGIYLIHPVVARFLEMLFHLAVDFSPLPIFIILILRLCLVFIISFVVVAIARKVPVVKLVFGEKL